MYSSKKLYKLGFLSLVLLLCSCSNSGGLHDNFVPGYNYSNETNESESYLDIEEKDFVSTSENAVTQFSLDGSTGSYPNIRKAIENGKAPIKSQVIIEQMLNYFSYSYERPSDSPIQTYVESMTCPWNEDNLLASVAVVTKDYDRLIKKAPSNFVFLLDTSGSMYNDLTLVQESFKLLVEGLDDEDVISIVTYAGSSQVVLDGARGYEKQKIMAAIEDLTASGSTNGSKGIQTAYDIAAKYYIEGGVNRIFLATDGDFNVGISSINGLKKYISQKRDDGIYLSLLGFGSGNYQGSTMQTLADNGNGTYYYIDSLIEARKVFVEQLGSTLKVVAKDAKAQITFNSEAVSKYRLLGYENRMISSDDFNNNEKDAGELSAASTTLALVEIVPTADCDKKELLKAEVRYKDVDDGNLDKNVFSTLICGNSEATENLKFAASVAEFALILRDSKYKANASIDNVLSNLENLNSVREDDIKQNFYNIVKKYQNLKY